MKKIKKEKGKIFESFFRLVGKKKNPKIFYENNFRKILASLEVN